MLKSQGKLKAWGNSIGLVLPKDALKKEGLSVNDEVEIIIKKKTTLLKDCFGKAKNFEVKSTKSTDELLKDIDEELKSKFE